MNAAHADSLLTAILFYAFAALAAASAFGVVLCRNIVRAAVCLMFALVAVAGIYFLLDAEFLAAVQLVVYVGGTLILIVFGVMLTSRSAVGGYEPRRAEVVLAMVIAALLASGLIAAILHTRFAVSAASTGPTNHSAPLRVAANPGGAGDGGANAPAYPMTALGQALLGEYLFAFELASVILLVVLIGAAYLARRQPRSQTMR